MPTPRTSVLTLAEFKTYQAITGTALDAVLQPFIDAVTPAFNDYCGRNLFSAVYDVYRDGSGGSEMMMANWPITSVNAVQVGTQVMPAAVNGSNGYMFDGRNIWLVGYAFTYARRNVHLNYTAGYEDAAVSKPLPKDIILAANMYVSARWNEKGKIGVQSKTLAGESISYGDNRQGGPTSRVPGMPASVVGILDNYTNNVPVSDC